MSRQANRTLFIGFVTATLRRRVHYLIAALTLVSASISAGPSMLILTGAAMSANSASRADDTPAVHALFDLSSATASPFPSDRFTVADPDQTTGRRVALPMPADCVANRSDCQELAVINQLDGFHQHPRVSIPFDGDIDPATARGNIFLVELPEGVSDPSTGASCENDQEVVEDGATVGGHDWHQPGRLGSGNSHPPRAGRRGAARARPLRARRHARRPGQQRQAGWREPRIRLLSPRPCAAGDAESAWYRRQLLRAGWAARRVGVRKRDIAALSVFHTQSRPT